MKEEKRERVRIRFKARVIIKTGNFVSNILMTSVNISMTGLLAETNSNITVGEHCDLAIIVPGRSSKLVLHIKGIVTRKTKSGLAFQFDDELEWWGLFSMYSNYGK